MLEILTASKKAAQTSGNIKKAQPGNNSILVLTTTGNLYGRGRNTEGQLGQGTTTNVTGKWVLISQDVKDFWITSNTLLFQRNDLTWWYTGTPTPITGVNSTPISTAIEITNTNFSALGAKAVYSVKMGVTFTYILDMNKNLYTVGANTDGVLFTGNVTAQNNLTLRTETGIADIDVDRNGGTGYILYTSGVVKGAGNSAYGQLGITTTSNTSLQTITTGATAIYSAFNGSFIKKSDGLYAIGRTFTGQIDLGLDGGANDFTATLTKVTTPANFNPDAIYSGAYGTHAYWNGNIYYTGTNSGGANGGPPSGSPWNGNISTFTMLPATQYPSGAQTASSIVPAPTFTKYMVYNGYLYGCGATTATYDLLPGYSSSVFGFKILDTSGVSSATGMTYSQFTTWLSGKNITTSPKTANASLMAGKYTQAGLDATGQLLMYGSSYGSHMTQDSLIRAIMVHACPTQAIADALTSSSKISLFLVTAIQTYPSYDAVTRNGYTSRTYTSYPGATLVDFVYYDSPMGVMMRYNPSLPDTPVMFDGTLKTL